ncbi:MAG: efflux RND transporter periplasmic adaptor subunit [Bacteroidia bacterium]
MIIRNLLALLSLSIIASCSNKENSESEENQVVNEYPVIEVFTKDITSKLEYVADIHAVQNVEIRARVEGYLEAILVDEGKEVTKGQALFQINQEEYQAELNRAKANLKSAEAETKSAQVELERVKLLVDKNVIAKTELDLAEAKLEIAKAKIEQAKADEIAASVKLANTYIRSPFNGIIDRIPFKIGSLISEGSLLTTISDVESVNAYFKVSEVEYLKYFNNKENDSLINSKVQLILADGTIYPFNGKIETMETEFEIGTGALAVRAKFKNPDKVLKHGSTGKIVINEVLKNSVIIPQKSTIEIQDKNYVFLVDNNNMLIMKSFKPSQRYGDFYIVSEGLKAGDKIVYEGVQSLKEGKVIQPKIMDIKEILKELEK